MGGYDKTPEQRARDNQKFFEIGWLNMVVGCCGSTPPHIKAIEDAAKKYKFCNLPDTGLQKMLLSGLEDLVVDYVY